MPARGHNRGEPSKGRSGSGSGGRSGRRATAAPARGGLDPAHVPATRPIGELRLLRAIDDLEAQLRATGDISKAAKLTARAAMTLAGAQAACVAVLKPGSAQATALHALGAGRDTIPASWDLTLMGAFARGEKIDPPPAMALARLKRRARPWATLAVKWNGVEPDWETRNAITRLTAAASLGIESIERQRTLEVRARIDRKIMEQVRAKDLFYHILDGLKSLTGYDHTGMLLTADDEGGLVIAAEQLAWRKGKSQRIGAPVLLPAEAHAALSRGRVCGLSSAGKGCEPWDPMTPAGLIDWLARGLPVPESAAPPEAQIIGAPLMSGDRVAAVLRVSALHPGTLGMYEADLVESFLPQALVAIQNAQRTETLTDRVLQAERKHAMAELARGVAHDVNNALGAILPLAQQLREDAARGAVDPAAMQDDLAHIERSVQAATRIFQGMLKFARQGAAGRQAPRACLNATLDNVLALAGDGLKRRKIELVRDLPADLPHVPLPPTEAVRVLLNLVTNAREAMLETPGPHRLTISARVRPGPTDHPEVILSVEDTGPGIAPEHRAQIFEPFFTTKPKGSGLGLSTSRAIVWAARGRMEVLSPVNAATEPCAGCRFTIALPALAPAPESPDAPAPAEVE